MQRGNLTQCAKWLNIAYKGPQVSFTSISTDTRSLQKGSLFVALEGLNFNGHHFIQEAIQKGAVAALVHQPITHSLPCLQVLNTTHALGILAKKYRSTFSLPIVALTGSCGKTTTKEYLKSILAQSGPVLASIGSFNNEIGVPLTLFKLKSEHHFAVLEIGANAMGEIASLTNMLQPQIALVLNVSPAHLEGFGSLSQIAKEKSEIFTALDPEGIAILQDEFAKTWSQYLPSQKTYTFGRSKQADVTAHSVYLDKESRAHFILQSWKGKIAVDLPLLGLHQVDNALAAAAAALALDVSLTQIKKGLEVTAPVPGRTVSHVSLSGTRILDDTYNAAPKAVTAAIDLLANYPGYRILVLGDMAELGKDTQKYHHSLGIYARQKGIDTLFTYGKFSKFTAQAFEENARHFTCQTRLIEALQPLLKAHTTVLLKGSRMAGMENILKQLL